MEGTKALLLAVDSADPLALVVYDDGEGREALIDEVETLRPADWVRIDDPMCVFTEQRPVLLTPLDEAACVRRLEGRRDILLARGESPVVLFLLGGGTGLAALSQAPNLKSWLQGAQAEPDAPLDLDTERRSFEAKTGASPEVWLKRWRRGEIAESAQTHGLAIRAGLLEQR